MTTNSETVARRRVADPDGGNGPRLTPADVVAGNAHVVETRQKTTLPQRIHEEGRAETGITPSLIPS